MIVIKIDRLIGIITILLQKEKTTAPELAKRFEVSRRTINRDIEDICKAGIPIITEQGYGGGISISDGYKIDKALLTREELQAIFSGLGSIDSVSKTEHSRSLKEKLASRDKELISADASILIDLASHYQGALTEKIELIKSAISQHQIIEFLYFYEKGESLRQIEPYFLVFRWSSWYVYGYCLLRQDYRMFKLNRLWQLHETGAPFSPREDVRETMKPDQYFSSNGYTLLALFDASVKYRLVEEYGVNCYTRTDDGWLCFEREFVSYSAMREWVLSFGDHVQVIEPQSLIDDIAAQIQNLLRNYRKE